jgi:hypothetical protein
MSTHKVIHICKHHKPTHKPKLAKEYSFSIAPKDQQPDDRKEHRSDNITYTQAGVSCFVGQESGKFKVQFFVGSSVVKIPCQRIAESR